MQNQIPLKELKHSPDNVRKVKASDSSLESLAASIKSKGLLHNLVVVKNGRGFNVIDGNRRLDALNKIYKDKATPINCIVLDSDDKEVGLHANMMREDMHPLDECDVIQALVADGTEDYSSVGLRFGQTENWVRQRISLSELSTLAKEKFRDYEFNLGVAKALTLGTTERQDKFLNDYENYTADAAKRFMTSSKIDLDCALFKVDDSNIDELAIEKDLFGGDEYITNFEAFERMQMAYLNKMKEDFYAEGYSDVVLLIDEYAFDNPETKNLQRVWNDSDYDKSQMIKVITYSTYRYMLSTEDYVVREEFDNNEQIKESMEEAEELTPLVMSKPQRDILNGYYAEEVKCNMMDAKNVPLMMALLCHRKLGYGAYENVNRVGNIYADTQNNFPSGSKPDDNSTTNYEQLITKHRDNAIEAYNNDGTAPLHYCLALSTEELNTLFVACCLTGISRHDLQDETLKKAIGDDSAPTLWFKPDEKWLNKYSKEQIGQLETKLFTIDYPNMSKKDRVSKLCKHLTESPTFDPYGVWE